MIPKHNYYDPQVFEEEVRRLFGRGWQFVAMADELARDRDFVCIDHHGASVVVQNFKGELRAFQNVCTHRFNRIQWEDRGNRPLSCRYHGWTYDRTGFPASMPKRDQFLTGDDASLCLTAYPIEACGKFVFVNLGGSATLRDQLGEFYDVLEEIGTHLGAEIHFRSVAHAANWKLLVENVLECYHCGVVHQKTFVPLGIGKLPIEQAVFAGDHSSSHFPRVEEERENLRRMYYSHLKERKLSHNSFYHIYIFPNLFIASSEGLSFYVGHALPVGPEQTMLRMRLFEPAVELTERKRERQKPINEGVIATSFEVVEEDRAILENIQRGIRVADKPGRIGDEEVRIAEFMARYQTRMAADA